MKDFILEAINSYKVLDLWFHSVNIKKKEKYCAIELLQQIYAKQKNI